MAELKGGLGLGQFDSGIDAKNVDGRGMDEFLHRQPLAVGDGDDIGEIDFALTVIGPDLAESGEKKMFVDQVDARIDFPDTPLLFGCVFFFNNRVFS